MKTGELISNEVAGVNQILPHKHPWAWELFLKGLSNNWVPTEIGMGKDIEQWRSRTVLSDDERLLLKRCLGFFAGSESLVSNNLLLTVFRYVTDAECRQYISRQSYEECYSDDTEILTEYGWMLFRDVRQGMKVAQYHADTTIDFVEPSHRTQYHYQGDMVHVYNKKGHVDLLVTPNHRMANRDPQGNLKVEFAKEVSYANRLPICAGLKSGGDSEYRMDVHDVFNIAARLFGKFDPEQHIAKFCFSKQDPLIKRLESSLVGAGYDYEKTIDRQHTRFVVTGVFGVTSLREWLDDFDNASLHYLGGFVRECLDWSGGIFRDEEDAGVVQAATALCGFRCHLGTKYDSRENRSVAYRISLADTDSVSKGAVIKQSVDYDGQVYCVTVPSGMLVVRRNGRVSISGNSLHNLTIVYICDALGLDINEVYEAYQTIPSIKAKDDFLMGITKNLNRLDFDPTTLEGKQEILDSLITYYILCEGTFFFSGFVMLLSFGRQNKMPGISEQVQYTLRDESVHIDFGTRLIREIVKQNPEIWTEEFQQLIVERMVKTIELEIAYAHDVLPNGVLGLNADKFVDYMQYIANRRLEGIGLPKPFKSDKNPFPWMSEVIDLSKEKNFFETRVTEYSVGTLDFADF